MTRVRTSEIAIIAIAGLLFLGAGCSSNNDDAAQSNRSDKPAQTNHNGEARSNASADLPEGWPTGVKLPEGTEIGLSKAKQRNGETILMVIGTVPDADMDSVYDGIAANLADAGFTRETPGDGGVPGYDVRALSATTNDRTVTVKVTMVGDDVLVNYTVEPRH